MADAAKLRLLLQAARRPDLIASIRNAIPKQFSPDTLRAILDDTFLGQLLPPGTGRGRRRCRTDCEPGRRSVRSQRPAVVCATSARASVRVAGL